MYQRGVDDLEGGIAVTDNMRVMLVAVDEHQHTVAWTNECVRVTGYPAEHMFGKPDAFVLFGDGAREDGGLLGRRRVQVRSVTCKDGSVRHVSSLSTELPVPGWSNAGSASTSKVS